MLQNTPITYPRVQESLLHFRSVIETEHSVIFLFILTLRDALKPVGNIINIHVLQFQFKTELATEYLTP